MAKNPIFDLFEVLCVELAGKQTPQIIDEAGLADDSLIALLQKYFRETDGARAFEAGVNALSEHFNRKEGALPFTFELSTRTFTPVDLAYIDFISFARSHRSVGGADSKEFEIRTMKRLRARVTGDLRRVGSPRDQRKTRPQMLGYLKTLGFGKKTFEPKDKDGGLDILWSPPLGAAPLRPLVSVQCKNGSFNEGEANKSSGRALRTLARHSHLQRNGHMACVVFNDYIDESFEGRAAGWIFLPLGLSDLAGPSGPGIDEVL
jgi:hypothetical protein